MSNIGKITLFVIFIAVFQPSVFAEEDQPGFGFSVAPTFGMLYGQAEEIVYKNSQSEKYESQLLWDMKPLFYVGLAADFAPLNIFAKHGFVGNLSFKMGIPQKTGIMEDTDWEDPNSGDFTGKSLSDNFSEKIILAELSLGYSFPLLNFMSLGIDLDFSYMHFSWSGRNGSGQYLRNGIWIIVDFTNEEVINYTQNWLILSPGVFLKLRLGRLFSLGGNFYYSPLIYSANRDDHLYKTHNVFQDTLYYDGQYMRGGGGITFSPMNNFDLTLSLSYISITGSRGDTLINYYNKYDGIAGGGYSFFDAALSARWRILGRK